jgi:hypothetical protein
MEQQIIIALGGLTDIKHLKDLCVRPRQLVLEGSGSLNSCMMTFSRENDFPIGQKDLLFLKPLHEKSEILVPHLKDFSLSGYTYCSIEIFTGKISEKDKIILYLSPKYLA